MERERRLEAYLRRMEAPAVQKRARPRQALRLEAEYTVAGDEPVCTETVDVSEHGCALLTGDRMESVGSRLTVRLRCDRRVVRLEGSVVWSRAPRRSSTGRRVDGTMGVRFLLDGPEPPALGALLAAGRTYGR